MATTEGLRRQSSCFAIGLLTGLIFSYAQPGNAAAVPDAREIIRGQSFLGLVRQRQEGDLDAIRARGLLRVLVVPNKTHYFVDRGRQYGVSYDMVREFERELNSPAVRGDKPRIAVVIIPVHRNELIERLANGLGDLAVANITATPERARLVDFSIPFIAGVSEILVEAPASPAIGSLEDLSGRTVFVRKSTSFFEHLSQLNENFQQQGKPPARIMEAPEHFEAEDILEMVNANIVPYGFVDSHIGRAWTPVFPGVRLNEAVHLADGQSIAWAIRKGTPQLKETIDRFMRADRKGTLIGNTVLQHYLKNPNWVRNVSSREELARFERTIGFFREYATEYDFDPLMLVAQGYQESGLDQTRRSRSGAIGIMQVLPSTGESLKVGDIRTEKANIHAGAKYMRQLIETHFDEPGIDDLNRTLFAFAAYNAGPARVRRLRQEAAERGLNPNLWFQHVETVAALRIGRETSDYVSNIAKYYIAYRLIAEQSADGMNRAPFR